ncbi:hypothetical protein [Eggerthella timonensis]|uniref:hypothetical protein n=1 Tax=Eggerthella timonensis TaxID=1871008 RepID=UPI000C76066F|nr:hypothetical protein [Eggerthella timonensis]
MRKTKPRLTTESGQAAFCGLVVALTVLAALALPAYEAGRAINDRVLAASAAEDAAKAVAANPAMTQAELDGYLARAYPDIAGSASITMRTGAQKIVPYSHRLNSGDGSYQSRPSNAVSRDVTVNVSVSKDYATAAGAFVGALTGTGGYTVSATGHAAIDETVSSGRW